MKKVFSMLLALVAFLTVILGVVGCQTRNPDVVATVNGEKITTKDLDKEWERLPASVLGVPSKSGLSREQVDNLKKRILWMLMEDRLILQQAAENGITVSESEMSSRYQIFKGKRSEKEFAEELKKMRLDKRQLLDQIKRQRLKEKLLAKVIKVPKVTEKELKKYYEENKTKFTRPDGSIRPYEEAKPELRYLLITQKRGLAEAKWLDKVKAESDVRIYYW